MDPPSSTAGDVEALADLPPREVLLARMAGGFQAPLVKAARVFGALQNKMAYAVKALLDKRVAAGEVLESPGGPEQAASEVAGEAEPAAEAGTPDAVVAETPETPRLLRPRLLRPRTPERPRPRAPSSTLPFLTDRTIKYKET